MRWNKPTEAQIAKYAKGCTFDVLYPPKKIITGLCEIYTIKEVENLYIKDLNENPNMARVTKNELLCIEEREARDKWTEEKRIDLLKASISSSSSRIDISFLSIIVTMP